MLRKIRLYLYRGIIFVSLFFFLTIMVNYFLDESASLLYYDIKLLFCDNKTYLYVLIAILFVLCGFMFLWIRGSQKGVALCWKIMYREREKFFQISANKINYGILFLALIILAGGVFRLCMAADNAADSEYDWDRVVAHSFGNINGNIYTGCLEAFETNYELGYRTFEVDLSVTSDSVVVLRHDWNQEIQDAEFSEESIPTAAEFLSVPILDQYTPLTFEQLCVLMKEYPDIWIVVDSKIGDEAGITAQYQFMTDTAKKLDAEEVLDRLVIQIYNEEMYEIVTNVYPFKNFIFTLYRRWDGSIEEFISLCRWSVAHEVKVITMWGYLAEDEVLEIANRYGIDIYVHTINDVNEARQFLDSGVKGIYTDFVVPRDLEED